MDFENYPSPPVQEAVLDIYVSLPGVTDLEKLMGFGALVSNKFPDQKPRNRFSSKIELNFEDSSKSSTSAVTSQTGWIFRTPQKERAVQARLDGFTYNRLPTYAGWQEFRSEAQQLWSQYRDFVHPQFVTALGLRYINRVLVPIPFSDFRDYCVLFPDLPKGCPTLLDEFFMRFAGPSSKFNGIRSAISVTFQPPLPGSDILPLILDVQATQSCSGLLASDDKDIWNSFERLREEKNIVFESSITDSARKLFRK